MRLCLEDAGVAPDVVDYINAHGTSTGLGDLAETKAMKLVFGPHARRLQVSSTKSELGHLLGASGGVELVASALVIHTGVLPPTINLDHPGEGCDLDYIPNVAREVRVNHVMSNSFGFGGHNASLLIGRYVPTMREVGEKGRVGVGLDTSSAVDDDPRTEQATRREAGHDRR